MTSATKRTVELPPEQSAFVDKLIASGRFRTDAEVVHAGLLALYDQDEDLETWLRDEVVPVVEVMRADPARGREIDAVFDGIRSLSAERMQMSDRDA